MFPQVSARTRSVYGTTCWRRESCAYPQQIRGLAVLRDAWQRFGMEKLLPMCAAACELCQQSETFDEDDLYEATTRFETTPSRNCDMLLRSQCAFPRELVEVRRWTKS